jgi:hypothetical protein
MWRLQAVALGLVLAGCADDTPPPAPHMASRSCQAVAQVRLDDSRAFGDDAEKQGIIFRGAYGECLKSQAAGITPWVP